MVKATWSLKEQVIYQIMTQVKVLWVRCKGYNLSVIC